jgi:hypothetical protein
MKFLGTITVPAGRSRNNLNTGAAILDLSTLAAHNLDTKVRAHLGGAGGNAITVQAIGDSPAGGGVSITASGNALVIHYEAGVSTVGLVEAAIRAIAPLDPFAPLGAPRLLIDVDAPGTSATVLNSPGDDFVATHLAGGAAGAFFLSVGVREVTVRSAGADLSLETLPTPPAGGADTSVASGKLLAAATDTPIKTEFPSAVLAAWNAGGGPETLSVWASQVG